MECECQKQQYHEGQRSGLINTHVIDVHPVHPDQENAGVPGDDQPYDPGDEAGHLLHAQLQGDVPGEPQPGAADNHLKMIQSTTIPVSCLRCVGVHDTPIKSILITHNILGNSLDDDGHPQDAHRSHEDTATHRHQPRGVQAHTQQPTQHAHDALPTQAHRPNH